MSDEKEKMLLDGLVQAPNDLCDFDGLFHYAVKRRCFHISHVKRNIELRAEFRTGRLCDQQKTSEISSTSPLVAFGNIRHNGNCRSAHLIDQRLILKKLIFLCDEINGSREFTGFLPGNQILKTLRVRHVCLHPKLLLLFLVTRYSSLVTHYYTLLISFCPTSPCGRNSRITNSRVKTMASR